MTDVNVTFAAVVVMVVVRKEEEEGLVLVVATFSLASDTELTLCGEADPIVESLSSVSFCGPVGLDEGLLWEGKEAGSEAVDLGPPEPVLLPNLKLVERKPDLSVPS